MWHDVIIAVAAPIITFLLGLIIKSPVYQKSTHLVASILKAAEDGKITRAELEDLYKQIEALLKK